VSILDLFPDSARIEQGELEVGGLRASELAREFGTPLVVYCEQTLRARARAYREAVPNALVVFGSKAFPNVAVLRLFAEEGLGADVSTLGELEVARRAGIGGEKIVVHGNNKSDEELRAAAEADVLYLVLDAPDEVERAAAAGIKRALVRVTPGIEVDTHEAIQTAHRGSKFGLTPEQTIEAVRLGTSLGMEMAGLHIHLGSQLLDLAAPRMLLDWLAGFVAVCRTELAWAPAVVDVGGGLGIRYTEAPKTSRRPRSPSGSATSRRGWHATSPRTACLVRGSSSSPAARSSARPASPSTRSASSRSPLRARPGWRWTAATPITRARSSTAPATRPCSLIAPASRAIAPTRSVASTARPATFSSGALLCRNQGAATCWPFPTPAPTR